MIIRRERPSDHDAVRGVHRAAFAVDPVTGAVRTPEEVPEARLVDRLREDAGFLPHLSLVAVEGTDVVGHVIATRGWLEPFGTAALGLGPLGVVPGAQRRGSGTALVHAVCAVAEAAGERLVALLGAPGCYGRLGFAPALALGVTPPDPARGSSFQARLLQGDPVGGAFRYAEPFSHL